MESTLYDESFTEAMRRETEKAKRSEYTGPLKEGKVVAIHSGFAFLDMGGKSEVVVPLEEFPTPPAIDDVITVMLTGEKNEGMRVASITKAKRLEVIDEINQAYHQNLPIKGTITEVVIKDEVPKGFIVNLGADITAFLPYSHLDTRKVDKLEQLIGQTYDLAIIEKKGNNITVSRRVYLHKTIKKLYERFFAVHQVGDIIKGKVESIDKNYLILESEGIKAFLHISDFSWKYLTDLKDVVKLGDMLEVQIISMDKSKDSVKVSKKLLIPNPWDHVEDRYSIGDLIKAKVVRFRRDGVMVEIEDGIEGFLHVSEMSWTERVTDPKKFIDRGAIVDVKIKNIDLENKRIDVSLRELEENPWENATAVYTPGRKFKGKVTSLFDFGVFVKFDDGIEGLLRREDVDWLEPQVDLKKRFKRGQEIEVIVLSLDASKEKLRLGIKQLFDNPLKSFAINYPRGSIVEGKVKSVQDNGIIVSLENKLEGFIHLSNLDHQNIENIREVFTEEQPIKAVVLYVDIAKNKIELSRKDLIIAEEKQALSKYLVEEGKERSLSTSIGSLVADQLKDIQVEEKSELPAKVEKTASVETVAPTKSKKKVVHKKTSSEKAKTTSLPKSTETVEPKIGSPTEQESSSQPIHSKKRKIEAPETDNG